MIKNQHQYRVTRAQLRRLEEALKGARAAETSLQPALHEAVIAGLEAQIAELQQEVDGYTPARSNENIGEDSHSMS